MCNSESTYKVKSLKSVEKKRIKAISPKGSNPNQAGVVIIGTLKPTLHYFLLYKFC